MKRAHRRLHLLLWLVAGPVAAAGLVVALRHLPAETRVDLPTAAVTDEGR